MGVVQVPQVVALFLALADKVVTHPVLYHRVVEQQDIQVMGARVGAL
jgi:hypothetical protein